MCRRHREQARSHRGSPASTNAAYDTNRLWERARSHSDEVDSGFVSTFLNDSTRGRRLIRCHAAHKGAVKFDLSEAQSDGFLLAGRYTLLGHERALQRLMDVALAQNLEIVVGGPYSSGILADGAHFEYQKAGPTIIGKVEQIKRIAAVHGVDIKAVALQFSLANPAVAAVIRAAFWQAMREAKLVSERAPLPLIGA